jgi:trans-aconitate methyltransferase
VAGEDGDSPGLGILEPQRGKKMEIPKQPSSKTADNQEHQLDWQHWFNRWEAMQNAYLPQRATRFNLMFSLPDFPQETELHILDLGCGPGSLSFTALQHFPHAHVVAVDTDPILLTIGEAIGAEIPGDVLFLNADIRDPLWWESYRETFNLVISATALHWLNIDHLTQVYARIYRVLQPGGWFFNADHIASDDPGTQNTYRQLLAAWQTGNFNESHAENWETFWQAIHTTLSQVGLTFTAPVPDTWEGSDDGLTQSQHCQCLQSLGFENIHIHWQYLGEALLGAQKPVWSKSKLLNAYARLDAAQKEKSLS